MSSQEQPASPAESVAVAKGAKKSVKGKRATSPKKKAVKKPAPPKKSIGKKEKKTKKSTKTAKKSSAAAKDKPKRPLSSYLLFCKDARPDLTKKQPELKGVAIVQALGALWRELPAEKKKGYTDQSSKDNELYKQATASYEDGDVYVEE